jgi:hypothetical protein
MPLNAFRIDRLNSLYCQCLRCIPRGRTKIAGLGVCRGKGIDRVLVLPFGNAASSFGVFDRLLAIAKRWIRASCLQPRAVFQRSAQSNAPRVNRNEIVNLLQRIRVFPKVRVDAGTQKAKPRRNPDIAGALRCNPQWRAGIAPVLRKSSLEHTALARILDQSSKPHPQCASRQPRSHLPADFPPCYTGSSPRAGRHHPRQ